MRRAACVQVGVGIHDRATAHDHIRTTGESGKKALILRLVFVNVKHCTGAAPARYR